MSDKKMNNEKQVIISSYQQFEEKYQSLGWSPVVYGGYEDVTVVLVSPKIKELLEQQQKAVAYYDTADIIKPILRQNPDDYILMTVYNDYLPLKDDVVLVKIHDTYE